jgi:TDG/mug DNA glycosylase family protein
MTPDRLRPGLKIIFCGYNPSLRSGQTGHHYAHPGNRFWRLLFAAGITDRLYAPTEDDKMLELGFGFTNLVARPTRRADELQPGEIRAGAADLRAKIEELRPRAVAYTGSGVYRLFRRVQKVSWGIQPDPVVAGVADVVIPSPSGLVRISFPDLVEHYRILTRFLD